MPTSAVKETLAVYAHAIDAIELSRRAALRTARSWSAIAESTFPEGWDGPWTLLTAGLDSAESLVIAQTKYANSILDATATALGVSVATNVAPARPAVVTATVEQKVETAAPPASRTPKVAANTAGSASQAPKGGSARGASRRRPPAG